jgi:hypothetical protein
MKSAIKVVKSRARIASETIHPVEELSYRQVTRAMVENVKSWVTQTKQRQRDEERKLAALLK